MFANLNGLWLSQFWSDLEDIKSIRYGINSIFLIASQLKSCLSQTDNLRKHPNFGQQFLPTRCDYGITIPITIMIFLMKQIKQRYLQEGNRLILESIKADIARTNKRIHSHKKYSVWQEEHNQHIFRSQRKRTQMVRESDDDQVDQFMANCSFDLKLKRWNTLESQEKRRIKSKISQKKHLDLSQQLSLLSETKKKMLRVGPLIYVKDMLSEQKEKEDQIKVNLSKLKVQKSQTRLRESKINQSKEDLTVTPLKLSIDLPRIQRKQSLMLKPQNNNIFSSLGKSLVQKGKRKVKKYNFMDLSPWGTKGQIFNPLNL